MPARYGPWQTVCGLFRRWQRDGTWQQVLTALQAQAVVIVVGDKGQRPRLSWYAPMWDLGSLGLGPTSRAA
jgi:transposase